MNLQQLIVEQSTLIDKQNETLKRLLKNGIYSHDDVINIVTATLGRIRKKAETEVRAITDNVDDKTKKEILDAIWFAVSAVKYNDLLNIKE